MLTCVFFSKILIFVVLKMFYIHTHLVQSQTFVSLTNRMKPFDICDVRITFVISTLIWYATGRNWSLFSLFNFPQNGSLACATRVDIVAAITPEGTGRMPSSNFSAHGTLCTCASKWGQSWICKLLGSKAVIHPPVTCRGPPTKEPADSTGPP